MSVREGKGDGFTRGPLNREELHDAAVLEAGLVEAMGGPLATDSRIEQIIDRLIGEGK